MVLIQGLHTTTGDCEDYIAALRPQWSFPKSEYGNYISDLNRPGNRSGRIGVRRLEISYITQLVPDLRLSNQDEYGLYEAEIAVNYFYSSSAKSPYPAILIKSSNMLGNVYFSGVSVDFNLL